MKEAFKAQRKQSTAPVVAAAATTSVSFAELPTKPSVPAGTSDSSLTSSLQGSSTTSHHASISAPPTTPAGYGSLAVVKQLRIRAPGLMALVHRAAIRNDWHAPKAGFSHYSCFYISFFMSSLAFIIFGGAFHCFGRLSTKVHIL